MDRIEDAIADFKEGKFVIVVDDEDRENEGDLIIAAEKITPEKVNFMLKHARGVLCAPITVSRCKELDLPHQVSDNTSVLGTPFTVTIDKLEGCSTEQHTLKICIFIVILHFYQDKLTLRIFGEHIDTVILVIFILLIAFTFKKLLDNDFLTQ